MTMRRPPPVHSPVSPRGIARGWAATLGLSHPGALERLAGRLRGQFTADSVLLVDSGTSALALAIQAALRGRSGAPVALPAYNCYDLVTAAAVGDVPVLLYDVDPTTLGPDWASLQRTLSAGAGAVVVAHLFGFAVDMQRAAVACAATGAVLIEDAAQGAGGQIGASPLGAHAPLSVLSFGRGKGMTGGGGGALLARDGGVQWVRDADFTLPAGAGALRSLAAVSAQWVLARPALYAFPAALPFLRLGETVYHAPHAPRTLAAGPATVAEDSLMHAPAEAEWRRVRARRFAAAALEVEACTPTPLAGSTPGYLRFPLLLDGRRRMPGTAAAGATRGYPLALADLPELGSRCRNGSDPFPGARRLAAELWSLPTHSRLSEGDVGRILAWIAAAGGAAH